ncbi:CGNR zinc finger domain-containing protein [Ktedonospora formicarum]|uniref:Zinc finger CGNR domain-containing protein n=1 Tax=Ktedonospora formicarum TaxID=2778364 RepID=A0A8J3I4Q4_9CHLR|nr:CGNR zinc finger domain-containing protein [Ktedonospora formicarum]GHO46605.1 hypothetical protein KSX_47680 [Ktedonospora formicarum]
MDMSWETLINTDWHDYRGVAKDEDRLLNLLKPGWKTLLREWWNIEGLDQPTPEAIEALQMLRTLLQRITRDIISERQIAEQDLEELNSYLEHSPSRLLLTQNENEFTLQRIPCTFDWSWLQAQIAASFATLLAEYDLTRVKQCANPDCRWTYYDESNSKRRRWCDEDCANIMRVRRFRERHHYP